MKIALIIAAFLIALILLSFEIMMHMVLGRKRSLNPSKPAKDSIFETDQYRSDMKSMMEWTRSGTLHHIMSKDHLMLSAYLHRRSSHMYFITMHGYRGNAWENGMIAKHFSDNGWNVLSLVDRAHKGSDGRWITMGAM